MDVLEIQRFIDYKPCFDENPQDMVDKIKKIASSYLSEKDIVEIQRAYDFTRSAHTDIKRLSGEPYIVHPVRATLFLMEINPDVATIQACLMHDILEDTPIDYETILKEFGDDVANLCEGLVKVAKVRYQGEERQLETLKKTFLAMGKDIRVILIKIVDRIHNIQTLHFHPKEDKRKRIAEETMKIYVPIAKRLGLYSFQVLLETGAFKILNSADFMMIFDYLKKIYGEGSKYTDKGIKILSSVLDKQKIPYVSVKGRLKSLYRIFQKLEDKYQTKDMSKVMDILAFRIVTDNVSNCYNILGIIHSHFIPLIKKIKDYIAIPKANGYKSIHTTVLGLFSFPVEIQIRTKAMDEVAEHGVVAHFAYSEQSKSVAIPAQQALWIKKLQDVVKQYTESEDKEGFKEALNIELLQQNIFVHTPKGEVIELPINSTVLDFAFKIHSEVGLRYKNAIVNGHIVPINYLLKTGDIVNINTYKNKYTASTFWQDFLHTPAAKSALQRYINQTEKHHDSEKGLVKLNAKLKELSLPSIGVKDDLISKHFTQEEFHEQLVKIFRKQISRTSFIKTFYPDEVARHIVHINTHPVSVIPDPAKEVVVDNFSSLNYEFCPECNPTFNQKIIAKSGKDGIKIHSLSCKAMSTVSIGKLLEAHREGCEKNYYTLHLEILVSSEWKVLMQMTKVLSDFHIDVDDIEFHKHYHDNQNIVKIVSHYSNPSKIDFLLNHLKSVHGCLKVLKKKIL